MMAEEEWQVPDPRDGCHHGDNDDCLLHRDPGVWGYFLQDDDVDMGSR